MSTLEIEHPADAPAAQAARARLGRHGAFVGGGTALQLAWSDAPPALTLLDITRIPASQGIERRGDTLRIGAAVRLETLRRDPLAQLHAPLLAGACAEIGALSVRHLATLGGNVGWGFGDTLAPLLSMRADGELADGSHEPLVRLVDRVEMPLLVAVRVGVAPPPRIAFREKVGHRAAFSPSRLSLALCADLDAAGRLRHVRAACCGAGLRARRLTQAEVLLDGLAPGRLALSLLHGACMLDLAGDDALARLASRVLAGRLREAA